MPNVLNERRLNEVRYVSMADYVRQMDTLQSLEDKMAFTTRYLLSYGTEQQRDVSFEQAIHIAKLKIADASAALRKQKEIVIPDESVNPYLSDEEDAPYRKFMIEPVAYLQDEIRRISEQESQYALTEERQARIMSLQLMSAALSHDFDGSISNRIDAIDVNMSARTVLDVTTRLQSKLGGAEGLEKAYQDTKPGVLSKMFGTSSVASHNLDEAYNAFSNPNHALYGDMNSLDKAAKEYLQHAFPDWNPREGLMNKAAIDRLSGTKKARALLSYNILLSVAEQKKAEPVYDTILAANAELRAEHQAGLDDPNAAFQQGVLENAAEDDPLLQQQAEEEYAANFAAMPEEELQDDGVEVE